MDLISITVYAFIGLGIVSATKELLFVLQSPKWRKVTGRVLKSEIIYEGPKQVAELKFSYKYEFKGKTYIKKRIRFGGHVKTTRGKWTTDEKYVQKYASGSTVEVIINPKYPSISAIETGSLYPALIMLTVSVVAAIAFTHYYALS